MDETQARFAATNFALGAVVSALLVLLVGVGFIAVTSDLLPAIGLQIVGATLAPLAVPFAVLLGAAFTPGAGETAGLSRRAPPLAWRA